MSSDEASSLDEVLTQLQAEIQRFFLVHSQPESTKVEVVGWFSRGRAIKEIEASRARFREAGSHS